MAPTSPSPGANDPSVLLSNAMPWITDVVRCWCHQRHLRGADIDDALDYVQVAACKALAKYDPTQVHGPPDLAFHAWLGPRLSGFLAKYQRGRKRLASHYDRSANIDQILASEAAGLRAGRPRVSAEQDPVLLAEKHEKEALLAAAEEQLSNGDHHLRELVRSGASSAAIARQLGISANALKRRVDKLAANLADTIRHLPRRN